MTGNNAILVFENVEGGEHMWYVIFFIVGVFIGCILINAINHMKKVGNLVIDFTNPMNDQPFLLELNKDVNHVYKKKYITLKVISDYHNSHK